MRNWTRDVCAWVFRTVVCRGPHLLKQVLEGGDFNGHPQKGIHAGGEAFPADLWGLGLEGNDGDPSPATQLFEVTDPASHFKSVDS